MAGSLFKMAQKLNPYASTMDKDSITNVPDWLSTGFYALNAILSADVNKGIPFGRVTNLFGPSQSGKSLISAMLQKDAIDKGMQVVIFDTEFDKDGRMEENFGVDRSQVLTIPVETVEELTIQSAKLLEQVINSGEEGKYFFVLDSLGFLSSEKELEDMTKKNKVAMDMGLKAKMVKTFIRSLKGKVAKAKCPFLLINHEIANPNQLHDSIFKQQGGGQAIEYVSSAMVHISATKQKKDTGNSMDLDSMLTNKDYTGQRINLFTQKNRMAKPHMKVECYLNFETGVDVYSGLEPILDYLGEERFYTKDAKGEKGKGYTQYFVTSDGEELKLGRFKEWRNDKEIWDKILPELNEVVNRELKFKDHDGSEPAEQAVD